MTHTNKITQPKCHYCDKPAPYIIPNPIGPPFNVCAEHLELIIESNTGRQKLIRELREVELKAKDPNIWKLCRELRFMLTYSVPSQIFTAQSHRSKP